MSSTNTIRRNDGLVDLTTPANRSALRALKEQVARLALQLEVNTLCAADREREPKRAELDAALRRLKRHVARLKNVIAEDELADALAYGPISLVV